MSYKILTRDQHYESPGAKRILALDGGGLRGILTLGMLKRIEAILQERHGDDFRQVTILTSLQARPRGRSSQPHWLWA